MFAVAALLLLPVTAFAGGEQAGLGPFGSAVVAGVGLALGVRLVRWRRSAGRS
jgi:hypothetical protein